MMKWNDPKCLDKDRFLKTQKKLSKWKWMDGLKWVIVAGIILSVVIYSVNLGVQATKWSWSIENTEPSDLDVDVEFNTSEWYDDLLNSSFLEEIFAFLPDIMEWINETMGDLGDVNFTEILEDIWQQVQDELGEGATWEDLLEGFQNGTLTEQFMENFFQDLINGLLDNLPSSLFYPIYIVGRYGGSSAIKNWNFNINVDYNGTITPLITSAKPELLQNHGVAIPIDFGTMISSVINSTADIFVSYLVDTILNENVSIEDLWMQWIGESLLTLPIGIDFEISMTIGIFPISVRSELDIADIMETFGGLF